MLTKEQEMELDRRVANYITGVRRTTTAQKDMIKAWAQRYRISQEQELLKRCKH